jgi:hypothetical protein
MLRIENLIARRTRQPLSARHHASCQRAADLVSIVPASG